MKRAQMLRFHYKYIPSGSFAARRNMLIRDYLTKAKKKDPMAAMQQMQDPDMMGVTTLAAPRVQRLTSPFDVPLVSWLTLSHCCPAYRT